MLKTWPDQYPNQEAIAKRIGKGRTQQWVSLHLHAFETAEELKRDRSTTRVVNETEIENMTERQLRALETGLSLPLPVIQSGRDACITEARTKV